MSKSMTFYTVYDINVFVHFFGSISKSMTFYTVYDIKVFTTGFGYVKIDDVLHCL